MCNIQLIREGEKHISHREIRRTFHDDLLMDEDTLTSEGNREWYITWFLEKEKGRGRGEGEIIPKEQM
jgi:hypothetical protein